MNTKRNFFYALIASLTLGLAPFSPEPHLFGKIKWVLGGATDMKLMDFADLLMHGFPWILLMYFGYQLLFSKAHKEKMAKIIQAINDPKAKIIDVREPNEYNAGHFEGAINFPLSTISRDMNKIKKLDGPLFLYCRSGIRSGQAKGILEKNQMSNIHNVGTMSNLKSLKNN